MSEEKQGIYVIYSRKSRFTGKGESVENQIEMCKNYIARQFGEKFLKTARVYEDEGYSGSNLDRPQFKQMMKDAKHLRFRAILVYRLDRISRNIGDFAVLIKQLGEQSIDFISIREQFDTTSPMGRAMMYIASVFSQLERETIAERIRDNMRELAKTGRWLGGVTPLGYESESYSVMGEDGRNRRACRLKPVPEEQKVVKLIFSAFLRNQSLSQTVCLLQNKKIKTRKEKSFTRYGIKGILTNPVYLIADRAAYLYLQGEGVECCSDRSDFHGEHGLMVYNRTLQQPGKTNKLRPPNEWIAAVGQHEGVIPGAEWTAVQNLLRQNQRVRHKRREGDLFVSESGTESAQATWGDSK